jgi:Tfp pilus assembly protein PilX
VKTKIAFILNNEDGYFMIMATLMILVLLTILGVAASRTANTEIAVSANEMVYQRNFYMAEGALIEAIDILANSTDLADNPPDTTAEESSVDDTGNTRFLAGVEGYGGGGSLDVDKPTVKAIGVYGRCQRNGVTTIKVGYLKVY